MKRSATDLTRDIDAARENLVEDELYRSAFAKRIADIVEDWRGNHSFVLGLYGEWGSGKTTLKNFVVDELQKRDEPPLIIQFNPWEWEGHAPLTHAFFKELAVAIGASRVHGAQQVKERLTKYAAYLSVGSSIANSVRNVLSAFDPDYAIGVSGVAAALKTASEVSAAGAAAPDKTLAELRSELREAIVALDQNILVVLDDVDRLTSSEIALLFQLIKANVDFPRVTYLLLCDRSVVAANLDSVSAGHGEAYLEKIVQLGIDIPKALPETLRDMVLREVTSIVDDTPRSLEFDEDFFEYALDEHAMAYLRTMRDVKRYAAAAATIVPAVAADRSVDLAEFFILEFLRQHEHEVYEAIYAHRDVLVGFVGMPEKGKDYLAPVLDRARDRQAAFGLVGLLFPRFGAPRYRVRPTSIAQCDSVDSYFLFATPTSRLSEQQRQELVSARGEANLVNHLQVAAARGQLRHALQTILNEPIPADEERLTRFIAQLSDFTDQLSGADGASDDDPYRGTILRFCYRTIDAFDSDQRARMVMSILHSTTGFFGAAMISDHAGEDDAVSDEVRRSAKEHVMSRIRSANSETLAGLMALAHLIEWWAKNDPAADVRRLFDSVTHSRDGVFRLLRAYAVRTSINTGRRRNPTIERSIASDTLSKWYSRDELRSWVETYRGSCRNREEAALIRSLEKNLSADAQLSTRKNTSPGDRIDSHRSRSDTGTEDLP